MIITNSITQNQNFSITLQKPTIEDRIKAHAETYSFNIESKLFYQLTEEQQAIWRKEIEQAVISGGEVGIELINDKRQKPIKWNEEDERIKDCLIHQQKEELEKIRNSKCGHSEIISDLKEMYKERIIWLKSLKKRMKGE